MRDQGASGTAQAPLEGQVVVAVANVGDDNLLVSQTSASALRWLDNSAHIDKGERVKFLQTPYLIGPL